MIQKQQDKEKLQQFLDAAAGQKEERVQAVNSQQDFQHSMQTMMTEMRKALKKNNDELACLRLQVDKNKAAGRGGGGGTSSANKTGNCNKRRNADQKWGKCPDCGRQHNEWMRGKKKCFVHPENKKNL